jgi:hypothetical protein
MNLRLCLIVCTLGGVLSACNVSVTSFPAPPTSTVETEATETPPTPSPYPDTPAPPAIAAPRIELPAFTEIEFFNELDGWGVTETYLVRTNDGGVTWYDVTPPDVDEVSSVVETLFLDKDHAWVQKPDFNNFPNNGLLYSTADGGSPGRFHRRPLAAAI